MSSKRFTEEQQQKLRQNPYVYNVTPTRLSLTKEFKERFIEACDAGESPRAFLENHGFSTELIGKIRVCIIKCAVKPLPLGFPQS